MPTKWAMRFRGRDSGALVSGRFGAGLVAGIALAILAASAPATAGAADDETYPTGVVRQLMLGGSERDYTIGIESDPAGNVYVVGRTESPDFRPRKGGLPVRLPNSTATLSYSSGFVTKFDPAGQVVYSTYLPHAKGNPVGMAVDPDGSVYVVTEAYNANVMKLNPTGDEILWTTLVGGPDSYSTPADIDVDSSGRVVVVGNPGDPDRFRVTDDARLPQPPDDTGWSSFLLRLEPDGSVDHASFLEETALAVEAGPNGRTYVGGFGRPGRYPAAPGTPPVPGSSEIDGTVVRLSPDLRSVEAASYVGGSAQDRVTSLDVAPDGTAHFAGFSYPGPFEEIFPLDPTLSQSPEMDATYGELGPSGEVVKQLARLGGAEGETRAGDVSLAPDGSALVVGSTSGAGFPAHGAPPYNGIWGAPLAFRVEQQQLTHSTAFPLELSAGAGGVTATPDGLVWLSGSARLIGGENDPKAYDGFVAALRLDPYVDQPELEIESKQSVGKQPQLLLRAGAAEDVTVAPTAKARLRGGRTVTLSSRSHSVDGYDQARVKLRPVNKAGRKALGRALRSGKKVRVKATVGFTDVGDATATERGSATLSKR
jgi:hypothetical protein